MVLNSYLDFDVRIESEGSGYRAVVIDSPAGQSSQSFTLPFSEKDLELLVLQVFRLTSRRSVRALGAPEMRDVRSFGGHLYEALFSGAVSTCLLRSMDEADRGQVGLRIRLHLGDAPALANVPWEFLYDSASDGFLCLSDQTPLVRYIDLQQRVEPLAASPPLRMLCLISSPAGYPPLDVEHEWAKLTEALGPVVNEGRLVLERVDTPSLEALQRKLRRDAYHVLHFVGHGAFDESSQDGVLLLETLDGRGHPVSGESLGVLLHDHESLRLVVLNACEGARTSATDPFAGTAQSLVRKGIPAVIAMQFEISDTAAITMANEFYSAVADGYPVDAALSEARKAIFTRVNAVEWATPVLYMRSPDGRIFDIKDEAERKEIRTRSHEPVVSEPAAPVTSEPVAAVATEPATRVEARPEPPAPGRPDTSAPPAAHGGPPGPGGIWTRYRGVILGAIAALVVLVVVGALISNNGGTGPGQPGTGQATSPPGFGLSDLKFVPASDVTRGPSGEMLRVSSARGGGFGAVGRDGTRGAIWISPDGGTWTATTVPDATGQTANQQVQGIVGLGSSALAIGYETSTSGEEYAAVWTSDDGGASWTPQDQASLHGSGATRMNRVTFDGRILIAVGRSGNGARLWTSTDGTTWATNSTASFRTRGRTLDLRDAVSNGRRAVAVGGDSASGAAAWYSGDPAGEWKRARVTGTGKDGAMVSVIANGDGFLAVGYDDASGDDDAAIWTSSDGATWNPVASSASLHERGVQRMRGVTAVQGLGFVAVGIDGSDAAVWVSPDGTTWARVRNALPAGRGRQLTGVVADVNRVVAVGREGASAAVWIAQLPTG